MEWVTKSGGLFAEAIFPITLNNVLAFSTGQIITWTGSITGNAVSAYEITNSEIHMYGNHALIIGY